MATYNTIFTWLRNLFALIMGWLLYRIRFYLCPLWSPSNAQDPHYNRDHLALYTSKPHAAWRGKNCSQDSELYMVSACSLALGTQVCLDPVQNRSVLNCLLYPLHVQQIKAVDNGRPQKSSTARLHIEWIKKPPPSPVPLTFDEPFYNFTVMESDRVTEIVGVVSVQPANIPLWFDIVGKLAEEGCKPRYSDSSTVWHLRRRKLTRN